MKKLIITLAAVILTASSMNAEEKTATYDYGDISSISAGYNYQIHITEGKSGKVKIVYDSDIEDMLKIYYSDSNDKLTLYIKNEYARKLKNTGNRPIQVYLEMDDIYSIDLSGGAKASFTGNFRTKHLNLDISGAATMQELPINGLSMDADFSGAANVSVSGNFTKEVDIDLSGASKMTFHGNSESMEADISGAGKMNCVGNFDECDISCSGASKAELEGKAMIVEFECSGASSIEASDFHVMEADIELSGASRAKVNASKELRYDVSSSSKMTYYGDAKLINNSSNSNIVKGN